MTEPADNELRRDYVFDSVAEVTLRVKATDLRHAWDSLREAMGTGASLTSPKVNVTLIEAVLPLGQMPTLYAIDGEEIDGDPRLMTPVKPELLFAWTLTAADATGQLSSVSLAERMGLTTEQVDRLIERARNTWRLTESKIDAPRLGETRVVPDCAVDLCHVPAAQVMTYWTNPNAEHRWVDMVCDEHAAHYRAEKADTEPEFRSLPLDKASTVPAHLITPWTRVWQIPDTPEWKAQEWRWVVQSVTHWRDPKSGGLNVRWTYADGGVQSFGYHELVTGWFSPEPPA